MISLLTWKIIWVHGDDEEGMDCLNGIGIDDWFVNDAEFFIYGFDSDDWVCVYGFEIDDEFCVYGFDIVIGVYDELYGVNVVWDEFDGILYGKLQIWVLGRLLIFSWWELLVIVFKLVIDGGKWYIWLWIISPCCIASSFWVGFVSIISIEFRFDFSIGMVIE